MPRKDAILAAAGEHFGRYGFRGASLRDIARDAGVSLTLLNHHFDNKSGLLSAVVASSRPLLRQRHEAVKRLRAIGLGVFEPSDLVRAWVAIAFNAARQPEGLRFLRVLSRMLDDGSEEAAIVRRQVQEAADAFIDALQCCYPDASRRAVASSYLCVSACLLRIVTSEDMELDPEDPDGPFVTAVDRDRLERFLVAGIDAALSRTEPSIDQVADDESGSERGWARGSTLEAHS